MYVSCVTIDLQVELLVLNGREFIDLDVLVVQVSYHMGFRYHLISRHYTALPYNFVTSWPRPSSGVAGLPGTRQVLAGQLAWPLRCRSQHAILQSPERVARVSKRTGSTQNCMYGCILE